MRPTEGTEGATPARDGPFGERTVGVGSLAEGEEVHDGVVHLQDGRALPVHDGQAGPPAHRIVGEAPREDDEGLPAKPTRQGHHIEGPPQRSKITSGEMMAGSKLTASSLRSEDWSHCSLLL